MLCVGCEPLEFDENSTDYVELSSGQLRGVDGWTVAIFESDSLEPARIVAAQPGSPIHAAYVGKWSIIESGFCGTHDKPLHDVEFEVQEIS